MRLRDVAMLVLSVITGFAGGRLSIWSLPSAAAASSVARANAFELLNRSGIPVGVWRSNQEGGSSLEFVNGAFHPMSLAITSDGRPRFSMRGRSGEILIEIQIKESGKPILGMGDKFWEGRVLLGSIESDSEPDANDDWGLLFRPIQSQNPVATIGMGKTALGKARGFLSVHDKARTP